MAGRIVSVAPSDMVAGGLIDDVDLVVTAADWVIWDYNGEAAPWVFAQIAFEVEGDDAPHDPLYLRAADPKHFRPTDDASQLEAVGEKAAINNSSNYAVFMGSAVQKGFPEDRVKNVGLRSLVGAGLHILRKPAPKRRGIIREEGDSDNLTQIEVSKVNFLPEQRKTAGPLPTTGKKAAPAKTAAAAAPRAQAAPVASGAGNGQAAAGDVDAELAALVVAAVAEKPVMTKAELAMDIFRRAAGPNKKAMTKRVGEDDFLVAMMVNGQIGFDGTSVTPGQ